MKQELSTMVKGPWIDAFAMMRVMVNEVLAATPKRRVAITLAQVGVTPEELQRDFLPWKLELERDGVEVFADSSASLEEHHIIFRRKE